MRSLVSRLCALRFQVEVLYSAPLMYLYETLYYLQPSLPSAFDTSVQAMRAALWPTLAQHVCQEPA